MRLSLLVAPFFSLQTLVCTSTHVLLQLPLSVESPPALLSPCFCVFFVPRLGIYHPERSNQKNDRDNKTREGKKKDLFGRNRSLFTFELPLSIRIDCTEYVERSLLTLRRIDACLEYPSIHSPSKYPSHELSYLEFDHLLHLR